MVGIFVLSSLKRRYKHEMLLETVSNCIAVVVANLIFIYFVDSYISSRGFNFL